MRGEHEGFEQDTGRPSEQDAAHGSEPAADRAREDDDARARAIARLRDEEDRDEFAMRRMERDAENTLHDLERRLRALSDTEHRVADELRRHGPPGSDPPERPRR